MSLREQLEKQLDRFEEIDRMMVDPVVLMDGAKLTSISRERGGLVKVATKYRQFKELNSQIADNRQLVAEETDPDLKAMASEELPALLAQRDQVWDELLDLTSAGDEANRTRCIMEIRAGTGGDEAALFARNLYEMYSTYAASRGWKVEIMDASPTELGGFKEMVIGIEGEDCFRILRYESGGHRVQRVPETETKGRIHTSAATVAVMAEPEDVEVDIKPDDYRLDLFCASGPGGQHVNKTTSAVRLTHFETGIVVECQDERSQHKNKAKALRVLKTRLYDHFQALEDKKRSAERKGLVGSGDRSERIRTYNFPENRLTDHRINFTIYKLDRIVHGELQPVIDALVEYDRQQAREAVGSLD